MHNKISSINRILTETNRFTGFTETYVKDYMDNDVWFPNYNLNGYDIMGRICTGVGLYCFLTTELLKSSDDMEEVLVIKNENLTIVLICKPADAKP